MAAKAQSRRPEDPNSVIVAANSHPLATSAASRMPWLQNRPVLALALVGVAALAAVGISTPALVEKRHIKVVNTQLEEKEFDPRHPALYERVYSGIQGHRPDIPVDAPVFERKLHNNIMHRGQSLDAEWAAAGFVNVHADADKEEAEARALVQDAYQAQREDIQRFLIKKRREEEVKKNRALRREKIKEARYAAAAEQDVQAAREALVAGEARRKLAHGHPLAFDPAHPALYDRVYDALVARGHAPDSADFERKLRNRVARRAESLDQKAKQEQRAMVEEKLRDRGEVWLRTGKESGKLPNAHGREEEVKAAAEAAGVAAENLRLHMLEDDYAPLTVCDRPADVGSVEDFETLQKYAQCQDIAKDKPILVLEGMQSHGRTGNNLIEFLHAQQMARDEGLQLGIRMHSWAIHLLTKMWMAIDSDDWASQFEKTFCVKIFNTEEELEGWDVVHHDTKELFYYRSNEPLGDYINSQEYSLRTLFRNYNIGEGRDRRGRPAQDMCSGIDALFGDRRRDAIYSVLHSRSLEGEPGHRLLRNVARKSHCDPVAALEMRPDYVKSILGPLGMLQYPIAFITDGQNSEVLERLRADPDIGPMLRVVPEEACWVGGDLTLAVMSNVFIGNPASSFTGFIAKARMALGFGHNYLFRAKDNDGQWQTVCGDHCIFDRSIMGVMS